MRQRLLLRQIAGLQTGAEASVLKVVAAWNDIATRRAMLGWHGADAAVVSGPVQEYLTLPPVLIGGGTMEIQLNVIGEHVLGLPR
jgi:alkylation response protein AidB-like acyl-CoA dehydrogenase